MSVLLWILGIIAALVGLLFLAAHREMRRHRRKRMGVPLDAMIPRLGTMLRQLQPGAQLVANACGRVGFLQVALSGRKGGWREVEFGLPDADWARPFFDRATAILPDLASESLVEENPGNPDVPRFLRVWIAGDEATVLARATALLQRAAEVLGFSPDQAYDLDFAGEDHPDFIRGMIDQIERDRGNSRLARWVLPTMRRQADEAERAMKARRKAPAR